MNTIKHLAKLTYANRSVVTESAIEFAAYAQLDLIRRKFASEIIISDEVQAMCAFDNTHCVGITLFDVMEDDCYWIYLSYVAEPHRGRGLFTDMMNKIKALAKQKKIHYIELGVKPANAAMKNIAVKTGFSEHQVIYRCNVGR